LKTGSCAAEPFRFLTLPDSWLRYGKSGEIPALMIGRRISLAKTTAHVVTLFALSNLWMAR
jgi:hypothetical protein